MNQSTFVSVVAWLALIFSGLAAVAGIFQTLTVGLIFPDEPMSASEAADMPVFFRIVFDNFLWFVVGMTAMWVATFVCALGLLRRLEWARIAFIALLILFAVAGAAVGIVQQIAMTQMFAGTEEVPSDAVVMMRTMRVGMAIFTLAFVAAFAFVAVRLNAPHIREEFRARP